MIRFWIWGICGFPHRFFLTLLRKNEIKVTEMVCSFLKIKYKSPLMFYVLIFNFFFAGGSVALRPVAPQQGMESEGSLSPLRTPGL